MLAWQGVENGREGLLRRESWFLVLEILYNHQGENHIDLSSSVFKELGEKLPDTSWRGVSGNRSFFRDYAAAWTNLGVMKSTLETDGYIELTNLGKNLVEHPESLTEFYRAFIDRFTESWDVDGEARLVSPFLIIARCLLREGPLTRNELEETAEADAATLLGVPSTGQFLADVSRRRFRTYLILLENANAIQLLPASIQFALVDQTYAQQLVGQPYATTAVIEKAGEHETDLDIDQRRRVPGQVVVRDGQDAFKSELVTAYSGVCAISGNSEGRVLEGAHIKPYLGRHTNGVSNGLLLAVDVHRLFDRFLLSISPNDHLVHVNDSILDNRYRSFNGLQLRLPGDTKDYPDSAALSYHYSRFLGLNAS